MIIVAPGKEKKREKGKNDEGNEVPRSVDRDCKSRDHFSRSYQCFEKRKEKKTRITLQTSRIVQGAHCRRAFDSRFELNKRNERVSIPRLNTKRLKIQRAHQFHGAELQQTLGGVPPRLGVRTQHHQGHLKAQRNFFLRKARIVTRLGEEKASGGNHLDGSYPPEIRDRNAIT